MFCVGATYVPSQSARPARRIYTAGVFGRLRKRCETHDVEIEHALVLRGVGIAFRQNVIAPREVAVVFAARSGSAGDDKLAVPVVGEAQDEARLLRDVVGEPAFDLNAGDER
jgi:hypothetical protein